VKTESPVDQLIYKAKKNGKDRVCPESKFGLMKRFALKKSLETKYL
jgi:hypothetical protein